MGRLAVVNVVSGFLGSGKTSAIIAWLRGLAGERVCVLVNEFGMVDLDAGRVQAEAAGGSRPEVVEIPGGCICCSSGAELVRHLQALADRDDVDRVLIEPTGLARAGEVVDLLEQPGLAGRLLRGPVVTLVDVRKIHRPPLSRMPLAAEQVEAADVLVGSFADVAGVEDLERFDGWAGGLYPPKLAIVRCGSDSVSVDLLNWPAEAGRSRAGGVGGAAGGVSGLVQLGGGAPGDGAEHLHGVVARGWTWAVDVVFELGAVMGLFEDLRQARAGALLRAKGVFRCREGWARVELAGGGADEPVQAHLSQHRRDSRLDVILAGANPAGLAWLEGAVGRLGGMSRGPGVGG